MSPALLAPALMLALCQARPPLGEMAAVASAVSRCSTPSRDRLLRLTVSDLATESGVDIERARGQLSELVTAMDGSIEVSQSGPLVYVFPRDISRKAARRAASRPAILAKARTTARACVGLMLLVSVALVRPLLARGSDAERVSLRQELQELRAVLVGADGGERRPCLALTCHAFMFGDGVGREREALELLERQYAGIAGAIRASKGAVCAEQVRPHLLELPQASADDEGETPGTLAWLQPVDECMVPVISRFDGRPTVSDDGDVVYVFPDLLPTATRDASYGLYPKHAGIVQGAGSVFKSLTGPKARSDFLEEPIRPFLRRGDAKLVLTVALANWVAVLLLGALLGPWQLTLRSVSARSALYGGAASSALLAVNAAYGALLVNGFAWVTFPAARRIRLWADNMGVRRRNRLRKRYAARLFGPQVPPYLRRKLNAVRTLGLRGRQDVKAGSDALYTTAKTLLEQAEAHDPVRDAWDEKLRRRLGGRASARGRRSRGKK